MVECFVCTVSRLILYFAYFFEFVERICRVKNPVTVFVFSSAVCHGTNTSKCGQQVSGWGCVAFLFPRPLVSFFYRSRIPIFPSSCSTYASFIHTNPACEHHVPSTSHSHSPVPDSSGMDEVDSDDETLSKKARLIMASTTRVPLLTLTGHTQPATAVVWGREEGEVVSGGWDNCIRLWDVEAGVNKATMVRVTRSASLCPFSWSAVVHLSLALPPLPHLSLSAHACLRFIAHANAETRACTHVHAVMHTCTSVCV